jgi:cytochrome c6
MKCLIAIALIVTLASCGNSEGAGSQDEVETQKSGEAIFNTHCAICHGKDGRKGLAGAKMIPGSLLTLEERVALITNGKGSMMPYRGILTKDEIEKVAAYTLTLN